ncbi:MAG: 4'-phosphopantetheinyl transferase superfamily protein [Lachnospiraceae bacterium]|nr:4'-phosphopantetheinyl transferase superfamily protein [Lachnospiraceae bacterium]
MIRIFLADLTCIFDEENLHRAFSVSSPQRQRKAEQYRNLPDQARCIGAGLLLEQSLWLYKNGESSDGHALRTQQSDTEEETKLITVDLQTLLNKANYEEIPAAQERESSLLLQYEKNGRPFLEGEGHNGSEYGWKSDLKIPYLSISHSGVYAALALSDRRVGIDIEQTRKIGGSVAKKILTPEEYIRYEGLQDKAEEAREYLLEKWTQKEAIAKLDGRGVFALLPALSKEDWLQKEGIKVYTIRPVPGYFFSVAYKS